MKSQIKNIKNLLMPEVMKTNLIGIFLIKLEIKFMILTQQLNCLQESMVNSDLPIGLMENFPQGLKIIQ